MIELIPAMEEATTGTVSQELYLEAGAGPPVEGTYDVVVGTWARPPIPNPGGLVLVVTIANTTGSAELLLDANRSQGTVRFTRAGPDEWSGLVTIVGPGGWSNTERSGTVRLSVAFRSAPRALPSR